MPPHIIESTAATVSADLTRLGVAPQTRLTITIDPKEPADWIAKARHFARPLIAQEGWSDAEIDTIIKQERQALHRAGQ